MKKGLIYIVLSYLLILSVSISSLPTSLLHHHHHAPVCEVNSDIPIEFRADDDASPVHLHEHQEECFLCFQNHFSAVKENVQQYIDIKVYTTLKYFTLPSELFSITLYNFQGRAPPISIV